MSWTRLLPTRRPASDGSPYDEGHTRTEEIRRFDAADLDYRAAHEHLDAVLEALGWPRYSEDSGTASIHWVLFAALSLTTSPRRILEIGTYDGEATRLLSALFPDAGITTVDLPHQDPRFTELYDRRDPAEREAFIATQARNTSEPNIELLLTDSFMLPALLEPGFDLIWVDGGHNYPVVAWDLSNAWHLATPDGLLLCDDVLTDPEAHGFNFVSEHSFQVTEYLKQHTPASVEYFLKRHGARWSAKPKRRKYVALIRKAGQDH